jgi:hypothetical protein
MGLPTARSGSPQTTTVSAASSIAVSKSSVSDTTIDDIFLVRLAINTNAVITPPAGWTARLDNKLGTNSLNAPGQVWYIKRAVAGDVSASSFSFSFSKPTTCVATFYAYSNVDAGIAIASIPAGQSSNNTGTNAPTSPTITTVSPNCLLIHGLATQVVTAASPPATFTEIQDTASTTVVESESSVLSQAAPGTTGTFAGSIASSQKWVCGIIALPSSDYPVFRASSAGAATTLSTSSNTNTNVPGTIPTGTVSNDLVLAVLSIKGSAPEGKTVTPPSGWTLIISTYTTAGATDERQLIFKKVSAGETGTINFGVLSGNPDTTGGTGIVHVVSYRNINTTTPTAAFGATGFNVTTSGQSIAPSLNTQAPKSLILSAYCQNSTATVTPASGSVERTDANGIETSDYFKDTQGATGTKTGTYSSSNASASVAVQIEVVAIGQTPVTGGNVVVLLTTQYRRRR